MCLQLLNHCQYLDSDCFFFNFHGKGYMYAIKVNTIIISQQNLKVQLSHVGVGLVGNFLSSVYAFKHPLKFKLKKTRYVFSNVLIISFRANQLSNFFYFFFRVVIITGRSIYSRRPTSVILM